MNRDILFFVYIGLMLVLCYFALRLTIYAVTEWRKPYRHFRYSVLYRLKRGVSISISLTFRCNYKCEYCTMRLPQDSPRRSEESTAEEWLKLIDSFPYKLKEVFISGGEPTLHPDFVVIVRELIRRKILVGIFTNLSNTSLFYINPSPYLRINASCHPEVEPKAFEYRVHDLRILGHQVSVDEVGESRLEIQTKVKKKITTNEELIEDNARLRFAPDRTAYVTCYDLYKQK